MCYRCDILSFLHKKNRMDCDAWFSIREVASEVELSVDRTRKHLSLLVIEGLVETKVSGWKNVYKLRLGRSAS